MSFYLSIIIHENNVGWDSLRGLHWGAYSGDGGEND